MMQQPNDLINFKEDLEENITYDKDNKKSTKQEEQYLHFAPEPISADNRLVQNDYDWPSFGAASASYQHMNKLDQSDLSLELDQNMINGSKGISVEDSDNSPNILGPQDIQLQLLVPSDEEEEEK